MAKGSSEERVRIEPQASLGGILLLFSLGFFAIISNNNLIPPILVDLSQEFSVSVSLAGQVVTAYAISSAIMALLVGPLIDRYGRRPIMLVGSGILAVSSLTSALAWSFPVLLGFRALTGLGSAAFQTAILTAIGDLFPYQERGKAMGWISVAASSSSILGVPIGTWLAYRLGWRWTFLFLAALFLAANLALLFRLPRREASIEQRPLGEYLRGYARILGGSSTSAFLGVSFLGGIFYFAWWSYMGAFFIKSFHLSTGDLAPIMLINGLGGLVGAYLGGALGDRVGKKPMLLLSLLGLALLIPLHYNLLIALWVSVAITLAIAGSQVGRMTNSDALGSELMPHSRGTMMSLYNAALRFGMMLGSASGGMVIARGSYAVLGLFAGSVAVLSALLLHLRVKEEEQSVRQEGISFGRRM